jgi:hypothetical protein
MHLILYSRKEVQEKFSCRGFGGVPLLLKIPHDWGITGG